MKMTLKQAIELMDGRDSINTTMTDALQVLVDQARATEHAQHIGKRVYYNGVIGTLIYSVRDTHRSYDVTKPEHLKPLPSATIDELKQAYCEYHGVDDVEVEG
jgi:hypothetical protein